ncbi:MAG: hypothetical protein AAGI28_11720 [Pseudomonadota bacterium]
MYTKDFFRTKLGQASLASIVATTAMIAFTTQMNVGLKDTHFAQPTVTSPVLVELA